MIKYNNKNITPKFNNEDVSRIMFNNKQIYPSSSGTYEIYYLDSSNPDNQDK